PTPYSHLFPYPTLFRSRSASRAIVGLHARELLGLLERHPGREHSVDGEHQITHLERRRGILEHAHADRGARDTSPQARPAVEARLVGVERPLLVERRPGAVRIERRDV